ncbi:outer membrane beta-barrel protein [Flavobacterium sp. NST-5]|uniref:Outer membrane beta-barrel protein n=2 Tax=Flavobacterium ichthyis TaxID=2698827 RepID=A0ABW9Z882_9FLAO|nr:outer membrane beta-barrel protein [Flavobacterium ichthyis]
MLLALSFGANAQMNDGTTRTASFGVKGGVNFATIAGGDDFDSPDSRTSFHVGVLGEFPVADIFSIQVEALYSGQGFESDIDGEIFGGEGKVEYQLDYINVPVLAKLYATRNLSFEVGPQFSFKVNEEIDADANADGGDLDLDEAKDFELGIAGGLTFQTDMGLFATGRYIYGLTDIIENRDARNSVFQIGIGYKF